MNKIYFGDNLPILQEMESESVDLIYIDPPFNTGKTQKRTTIKTVQSENGDRKGFQGKRYETIHLGTKSYPDSFDNLVDFLRPRLVEAHRILKPHGSLYFHIDYREVHYCKILLDEIFGRECFLNEIIWAYDYGGRAKSKWPPKHDNILYYVKDPKNYIFNANAIDREQYIAPALVGPAKAERGKLPTDTWWFSYVGKKPTDTWWQTVVPTNGRERIGYPTQKPRKLLDRIIKASSYPGMLVLDFFAGSGTVGESCLALGREFILIDNNIESLEVMARRFSNVQDAQWIGFSPSHFEERENSQPEDISTVPPLDTEYLILAASATHLQEDFDEDKAWNNSPFAWILHLSPEQKGEVGKQLFISWCRTKDVLIENVGERLLINGYEVAVGFSTLGEDGIYQFQKSGENGPEHIFYVGISPESAHGWVVSVSGDWGQLSGQESAWFSVNPSSPPDWLTSCGGTLDEAFAVLKNLSHRK